MRIVVYTREEGAMTWDRYDFRVKVLGLRLTVLEVWR